MADITDAPKHVAHGAAKGIKAVPKPVLIGVPVAVVALVYIRKVRNKGTTTSTNPQNATPPADQGMTSQYVTQPADYGGISNPGSGYGGGYSSPSAPSGSSDSTVQAQLGDVSSLIQTLFPGGLPLGSGPVDNPFPGQAASPQPVFGVPVPTGVVASGSTPSSVWDPAAAFAYVAAHPAAPAPAKAPPASAGTVTKRGTIIKVTHEGGKTCHYYAHGVRECF